MHNRKKKVMDLPFEENEVRYEYLESDSNISNTDMRVNMIANGPSIVLMKQLKKEKKNKYNDNDSKNKNNEKSMQRKKGESISVNVQYFDPTNLYVTDEFGEQNDKLIVNFYPCKMYGCRVILTNTSSILQKIEVLCRIPTGLHLHPLFLSLYFLFCFVL